MSKLSIIIPIYNAALYLHRCIDSILSQSFTDYELLLIDDGSTDKSDAICDEYAAKDNRIHVFHKENGGVSSARNFGLDNAQGEWTCFIDSDDWIEPNMVEVLVEKQQETNADIVSCNAIAHYSDHIDTLIELDYQDKDAMLHQTIQLTLDHVLWRRLIRRSLYEDNHIRCVEGVNIGEDHYTLPQLVYYAKSFAKVDAALYHYNCENQSSYMRATPSYASYYRKYSSDIKALDILLDFFKDKDKSLYDELSVIKINLIYNNLFKILKEGTKEEYDFSNKELSLIDKRYFEILGISKLREYLLVHHYYINKLRVLYKILLNKTMHIKRYYL